MAIADFEVKGTDNSVLIAWYCEQVVAILKKIEEIRAEIAEKEKKLGLI
jgi:hypothetical protein